MMHHLKEPSFPHEAFDEEEIVYIEDIPSFSTASLLKHLRRFEDEAEWLKATTKPYLDTGYWYYQDELYHTELIVDSIRDELENRGVYC